MVERRRLSAIYSEGATSIFRMRRTKVLAAWIVGKFAKSLSTSRLHSQKIKELCRPIARAANLIRPLFASLYTHIVQYLLCNIPITLRCALGSWSSDSWRSVLYMYSWQSEHIMLTTFSQLSSQTLLSNLGQPRVRLPSHVSILCKQCHSVYLLHL